MTYESALGPRAGVLRDEGVIDAWQTLGEPERAGLRELLAADRVAELEVEVGAGRRSGPGARRNPAAP